MPIKLSVAPQQFVDETGKPLVGRVSFFVHGTNQYAPIYTMQGTEFVAAQNPQLLDSMGRIAETVFFDADILDCFVQTYIGEPGQMTPDAPGEYWTAYDRFEVGIDYKTLMDQTGTVDDIDGLKQEDPTQHPVVQVREEPFRYYIWDEYATNTPDDGIVVKSDLSGDGRWLLLWDDEMLPSSIYGVKDGNYANLTMCLSYPDVVGSIGLATPPCVRIVPGTYDTTTWVSTTKAIAFGKGVKFTGGGITCPMAIQVSAIDDYVCDFEFTDSNAEAHSSWYRTATEFWISGAKTLIVDPTEYMQVGYLTSSVIVQDAVVVCRGRIPHASTQSSYFKFDGCTFVGERLFSPSADYVMFAHSVVDDSLFSKVASNQWDVGRISDGHHVECKTSAINSFPLGNFANADVWMLFYAADQVNSLNPSTTIDLEGRTVSKYDLTGFTTIKNMHVSGNMSLNFSAGYGKYLSNVVVDGSVLAGDIIVANNCTLNFGDTSLLTSLTAKGSTLSTQGAAVDHACYIIANDCIFDMHVNNATDNTSDVGSVVLNNCTTTSYAQVLHTKKLYMANCVLFDPYIEIYPYYDGANYRIDGAITDCTFRGAKDVHYTKVHTAGGYEETNCHHVRFTYKWLNNAFIGTAPNGILIDFWGVVSSHQQFVDRGDNDVEYRNNVGNCPPDKMAFSDQLSATAQYSFFVDGSWNTNTWYVAGQLRGFRAMPRFNGRMAGGTIGDFAVHTYKATMPFGLIMQKHACLDLMDDPNDYGDFCAICFASNNEISTLSYIEMV